MISVCSQVWELVGDSASRKMFQCFSVEVCRRITWEFVKHAIPSAKVFSLGPLTMMTIPCLKSVGDGK